MWTVPKLLVPALLLAACQGARAPIVTGVSPEWGSSLTRVTLTGEDFREDPTVWVDGVQAEVISAEADRIVIEPALVVDDPATVSITVQSKRGMSNPVDFLLVPSGTPGPSGLALPPQLNDAMPLGDALYLAATGYLSPDAGLYVRDGPSGIVTRVWAAPPIEGGVRAVPIGYDAPMQVATDGTDVWFGTIAGAVYRLDPATTRVDQVLAASEFTMTPVRAMTFDDLGNLYLLRNEILRLGPDGALVSLGPVSTYGDLASDGDSLYLTNLTGNGSIAVVEDPDSATPTWIPTWVPGVVSEGGPAPYGLYGIAVVGDEVVVSDAFGMLYGHAVHAAGADDGGPWEVWGDPRGYGYVADGMNADPEGDLFLTQRGSGMVRMLPASNRSFAPNLVVGSRPSLGITRMGTSFYVSTTTSLVAGGVETIVDGAIVELGLDGSSRLVSSQASPTGVVANGDGTLTVGDCVEHTLTRIDVHDKATTTLLDVSDGLKCVGQLWRHANGDLFYANAAVPVFTNGEDSVGRLGAGGENDPDFVTGLPLLTMGLAGLDDTLVMSQLMIDDLGLYQADATTGGEATVLVPGHATGFVSTIGASPRGAVYAFRSEDRRILEVDVATGRVYPFGDADLNYLGSWFPSTAMIPLSMGFLEDGTLILPDPGQGAVVAVAP